MLEKVKNQSGEIAKNVRESWGDAWSKTVQVLKKGASQVQDSVTEVVDNLGKRWDSMTDFTNFQEISTAQHDDSDKKEETKSKGGLVFRIRELFSSGR